MAGIRPPLEMPFGEGVVDKNTGRVVISVLGTAWVEWFSRLQAWVGISVPVDENDELLEVLDEKNLDRAEVEALRKEVEDLKMQIAAIRSLFIGEIEGAKRKEEDDVMVLGKVGEIGIGDDDGIKVIGG